MEDFAFAAAFLGGVAALTAAFLDGDEVIFFAGILSLTGLVSASVDFGGDLADDDFAVDLPVRGLRADCSAMKRLRRWIMLNLALFALRSIIA